MKNWTLSDLAEFGYIVDGSRINLHGTTYVVHEVNHWNDSCKLEDIGLQPEVVKSTSAGPIQADKHYRVDGFIVTGAEIIEEFDNIEDFENEFSYVEVA
jgi:hypothetical protein